MENLPAPRQAPTQLTRYDAKTADALISSYGGRLYAYFRLMLANESAAKRASADTLMTAAADPDWPRDPDQYAPRLFELAHGVCHKYKSADAVSAGRHWTVADGTHGGSRPGLPEIARQAVSRLLPALREAFILSAPHNHLSLPQIAEVLGVGLDAAADLRAQAGLDFVRAVQSCAREADFTEFSGADLRIRAEESLAHDASQPPPPLPVLSDPALAASPMVADSLQAARTAADPWFPGAVDHLAPAALPEQPSFHAHLDFQQPDFQEPASLESDRAEPDLLEEEDFPGEAGLMEPTAAPGLLDPTAAPGVGNEFSAEPDYTRQDAVLGEPDYTRQDVFPGGPGYYGGPGGYGPQDEFGGQPEYPTDPGLPLIRERPRRRGRAALAWLGGGLVAVAAVAIGAHALMAGPGNSIPPLPSGAPPSGAVFPSAELGTPAGPPRQSRQPGPSAAAALHGAAASHGTWSSGTSRSVSQSSGGTVPRQAAPQPTYGNAKAPAPVHATKAPAPTPAKPTAKPTASPSTSSPAQSPPATNSSSPGV